MHVEGLRKLMRMSVLVGLIGTLVLTGEQPPPASAQVAPERITAFLSTQPGVLTVVGDGLDNIITVSRDLAGTILINGGAVPILGGVPSVANTSLVQVFGLEGNDSLRVNEANGALPGAALLGGAGADLLAGGSGVDQFFGEAGKDTLVGRGGSDSLFGGANDDTLTGGSGGDHLFGEAGNDTIVWNPGDASDLVEGGAGVDTARVVGGNGAEAFSTSANGTRVRFDRIAPNPFALDIGTSENLVVMANGGDDSFSGGAGLAALIKITVDGGSGNDTLNGSDGRDVLLGGDGNDTVDGNRGDDVVLLGVGDDGFKRDPGDGNDVVEGQAGRDHLDVNGSAINETTVFSANGGRVRFSRDISTVVLDLDDIEVARFNALGGADTITVNDLAGTDLTTVVLDLGGALSSGTSDGQIDTILVNGTAGNDVVTVTGSAGIGAMSGLTARVEVFWPDPTLDTLIVNGAAGNDSEDARGLQAGVMKLTLNGGIGDDVLVGSTGDDVLDGGTGNDQLDGGPGADTGLNGEVNINIP